MSNDPIDGTPGRGDTGGGDESSALEELLRRELARSAGGMTPGPTPYGAIVRRGRAGRRRRRAALGAGLALLAAAPGVAIALQHGPGRGAPSPKPPAASSSPTVPALGFRGPASPGQLVDGVSLEEARRVASTCWASQSHENPDGGEYTPADLRILFAMPSDYLHNSARRLVMPHPEAYPERRPAVTVVLVDDNWSVQEVCTLPGGDIRWAGSTKGSLTKPGTLRPVGGPVEPEMNGFGQIARFSDPAADRPGRWVGTGAVDDSVARVTVTYGSDTREAILDHGWYVATGEFVEEADRWPRVRGYDAAGKLIYDSADDPEVRKWGTGEG
ncbi:hypothetical protein AB0M28_00605 [Streptomyces sp. NPDC051940]|uniref:hypothetical protein n=1 Tax=Streptomyces sp. NPDC051940 TaxID=3155675 RepID=UPI0034470996